MMLQNRGHNQFNDSNCCYCCINIQFIIFLSLFITIIQCTSNISTITPTPITASILATETSNKVFRLQQSSVDHNDDENIQTKLQQQQHHIRNLTYWYNEQDDNNDNKDDSQLIDDTKDYNINILQILSNVTNQCMERCINEEAYFLADFDATCSQNDNRPQCFRTRCFKGCKCWWQALREYDTCHEACASLQFYPYDLPCISACEQSQRHFWYIQRKQMQNVMTAIKPQLLLDEEFLPTITIQWPILMEKVQTQKQRHKQEDEHEAEQVEREAGHDKFENHQNFLANRPFFIQYQSLPVNDSNGYESDDKAVITNASLWRILLNYNCNDYLECDITDSLIPYMKYRFRYALIFGDNVPDNLLYSPTTDFYITTAWGKPLSPPIITSLIVIDHKQVIIYWQPGKYCNGPLKSYKLQLNNLSLNRSAEIMLLSSETNYYIFNDLLSNTNYSIQLSMMNMDGSGPCAVKLLHTPPMPAKSLISHDELEYVLLADRYQIILKSMDSLNENHIIYKSLPQQPFHDFDYHFQFKLIFLIDFYGDVICIPLDKPSQSRRLNLDQKLLNIKFKSKKLSIDWLNQRLYVAGEISEQLLWQIFCLDFNGTIVQAITEDYNITIPLQQISVDIINGWLFMLDTKSKLIRLNLGTKEMRIIYQPLAAQLSSENMIIGYFYNDYKHYLLLVQNATTKELYQLTYDGRYQYKLEYSLEQQQQQQQQQQHGVLQAFRYLNSQPIVPTNEATTIATAATTIATPVLLSTNGTHILWHDYETNEHYNWIIDEMKWCWHAVPILQMNYYQQLQEQQQRQYQQYPFKTFMAPENIKALLTSQMAKISWQSYVLVDEFQTQAAWQQWDYELEVLDVASNSAFNIRNIKTLYFIVERLQPNNQYHIKVRATSAAPTTLSSITSTSNRLALSNGISSDWSEPLAIRTWPLGVYKFIWATANGLYETNVMGEEIVRIHGKIEAHNFIQVNSTLFYVNDVTQQLACLNYINPEVNCSFLATNVYSVAYEKRSGNLYWSDTHRNCIVRKNLYNDLEELLPIFGGRFIRLDSIKGLIYYQTAQRLLRRPLNGIVFETFELEYYHTQNQAENILGFVLVPSKQQQQHHQQKKQQQQQYQLIYWLASQQDEFPILYKANADRPESIEKLHTLDHDVLLNTLEYLTEIDSFMWLKKDGRTAVIAARQNLHQYSEFDTPLQFKTFSVKLKNDYQPFKDLTVQPEMPVDYNSIHISDGYWNDFHIKWSGIKKTKNLTIFYRVLIEAQANNNNNNTMSFMTYEVRQPFVHVMDFKLSNDLIKVTITPHTYWMAGTQQMKQIRIPYGIPMQPKNLRVFVEEFIRPFDNQINNVTASVRWESSDDLIGDDSDGINMANPDIYYKVYCWLNDNLIQIQNVVALKSRNNHAILPVSYEVKFHDLQPLQTYNFHVQAYIQNRSLDDGFNANENEELASTSYSSYTSSSSTSTFTTSANRITYYINPEIQSIPKVIFITPIGIGVLDLDLNETKMLIHTMDQVEHLSIMKNEQRLIWVNENVELMSYTMGTAGARATATAAGTALKLARMRAEVLALTVDWIQRIIYWAELSGDITNQTVIDIYQLNLCHYDGKIMHGTKLLTINNGKYLKCLMILPYSQLLIWLEYDKHTETNTLRAWSLIHRANQILKVSMDLKYVFEGSFSSQMETINLIDNKGKLCSYDIQRELCTWMKIPLYKQYDHISRDSGYIYTLYNSNIIKAYNGHSHILEYTMNWHKNYIKFIKAYNYQAYPKRECLWPDEFTFMDQVLNEMSVTKGEIYIALKLPTKIRYRKTENNNDPVTRCSLEIPGIKYTLKIEEPLLVAEEEGKVLYEIFHSFNGLMNITNLKPYTNYSFNLNITSYYRERVEGLQSTLIMPTFYIITDESNPTMPRNFIGYALSPTEIWLGWLEPAHKNGKILYYELHWEVFGNSTMKAYRQINGSNVILNKLESSQDYLIWLEVYAIETKRNTTERLKIRTYDPPKELVLLQKRAYNMTLIWPDENWLNYYDKVFVIWQSLDNHNDYNDISENGTHELFLNDTNNQQNITIVNLQPKTKYEFHFKLFYKNVQRVYIWPEKPYDGWIYETLGDAPGTPGQPQFQHITGEIFKIYWSVAQNHGSPIVEYSLEALQAHQHNDYSNSNKRIRRNSEQEISSSILIMAQMPWAEEITPKEDQWLVYCNTIELSCIVKDIYSKHLRMFRVRARNELYGWGPYSKESKHIMEPFVTQEKRYSLVLAILAPAAIVLTCVVILVVLRKLQKRHLKAKKKLLDKSRPSVWSNLSNIQQQISLQNCAFSITSNSTGSPLTDADIALLPHIQWNRVTLLKFLGSGAFGEVYEGLIRDDDCKETQKVAIKCLRKGANEFAELLQEAQVMSGFHHENIVRLIGVCCETESISIIMEHMDGGDLLNYLREAKKNLEQSKPKIMLNVLDLLNMCLDVATGMSYLEDMHYVHRDLACRNCLISCLESNKRVVKIGDFGLARDVYKSDYYRKEGEGLLPVRWMAPESLIDGIFTTQSDVWSYGVLCWEIFTLGQQPYAGRNNFDVLNYIKNDGRLEQPENCPDNMFHLMLQCWHNESDERPTFRLCLNNLLTIKTTLKRYSLTYTNEDCHKLLCYYANHKAFKENLTKDASKHSTQALAEVYEDQSQSKSNSNFFITNKVQNFKISTFNSERDVKEDSFNDHIINTKTNESDISELLDCKINKPKFGKDMPDFYINEGISHL